VKPGITNEKGGHTKAFSVQFVVVRIELERELTISCYAKESKGHGLCFIKSVEQRKVS
jgi:hypothetical protein